MAANCSTTNFTAPSDVKCTLASNCGCTTCLAKAYPLTGFEGFHNFPGFGFAPFSHPNGVLHPHPQGVLHANGVPAAAAPLKNVVININQ